MNEPKPFVKVAVVASSLLLLNAFVAYHAGFFDSFIGSSASAAKSEDVSTASFSEPINRPPSTATESKPPQPGAIFYSSKSTVPAIDLTWIQGSDPQVYPKLTNEMKAYGSTDEPHDTIIERLFHWAKLSTPPAQPDAKPGSSGVDGKKQPAIFWGSKWSPALPIQR